MVTTSERKSAPAWIPQWVRTPVPGSVRARRRGQLRQRRRSVEFGQDLRPTQPDRRRRLAERIVQAGRDLSHLFQLGDRRARQLGPVVIARRQIAQAGTFRQRAVRSEYPKK